MKVLQINSVPYGSTAKVMKGISDTAKSNGHEVFMSYGYSAHPIEGMDNAIKIGGFFNKAFHLALARLTGKVGMYSQCATKRFLKKIDKINPDIIHLHNLHGWYINIPMLFHYIKGKNIKVIWTLHDCWAFTGHCPHFDMIGCNKWEKACNSCGQYKDYPQSFFDNSKKMYNLKRRWFTGVDDLTIVTPSNWLSTLLKKSFLNEYSVEIINNGIDLDIFKPCESDLKKRYGCEQKFIVLGVAYGWSERKGLDVFIELSKRLNNDFQIVLVGTDDKVDKILPSNIISIHRTQNQKELVELYSVADVFVNPTREEVLGMVNLEALACGTPVITFQTGGSPECIDGTCGSIVNKNDIEAMYTEIVRICKEKPFTITDCVKRANSFDMYDKFIEYLTLYSKE